MLLVGVDGDGDGTFDTKMGDSVHRVVSTSTTTADENARIWNTEIGDIFIEECSRLTIVQIPLQFAHQFFVGWSERGSRLLSSHLFPIHGIHHRLHLYS